MSRVRHIRFDNPGAGNDLNEVVPAGVCWRVTGMCFHYTCSAVVGNRYMQVVFTHSDGDEMYRMRKTIALTASQIKMNAFSIYHGNPDVARWENCHSVPLGEVILQPGDMITTETRTNIGGGGMDAGDFMDAMNIIVEEWKL